MTKSMSNRRHNQPTTPPSPNRCGQAVPLSPQSVHICPVCRHGHISQITLMDAFACDFCRHIFSVAYTNQTVQVVDSSQPMGWLWTGKSWRPLHRSDTNLTLTIWLIGVALVVLPFALVWMANYLFPPLPGSRWAWVSTVWIISTFCTHFGMVAWLLAEHYQLPLYVSSRIRLRRLLGRD
ncbi:MAG: hypothetical protein VKK04_22560 [Synechococcales bacterium]|nr:hypothetical protein [Synechococcales bacterium]